ncbi:MAG TPA: DUF2339 domain-containing protein [bacterium]|nr:DUF2339 domain-containing protein [bacterium]
MGYFFGFLGVIALIYCLVRLSSLSDQIKKLSRRISDLEAGGVSPLPKETPVPAAPPPRTVSPPPAAPTATPTQPPPYIPREVREPVKRTPPPPPAPRPPSPPNPVVEAIRGFFTGGNLVVRIGLIVLFLGITFLLKLAIDNGMIPIQLRLAAVALGALALIFFGWRLRAKRPGYALSLLGGGIGILYLNIFAAFRLYKLLPSGLAFGLLLAVVVFSSLIAVALRAQSMAVIGICGGFLAPVLTSTGGGSHVALFSYFLVLNLGILGIAWFRAWRALNLLGFFFTFTIGLSWGAKYYTPEFFATTEPFLIAFFLLYSIIPILFASRVGDRLKGFVDTTLVFGTPIVAFGLQMSLVKNIPHGLAWSSLALAVYYMALTFVLQKKAPAVYKMLMEAMLAIGVVFITLTIPLRMTHHWTCLSWALEGAALVWIGVRQSRYLPRLFGALVLFAAGFAYKPFVGDLAARGPILINPYFVGALFVSLASLFGSYWLTRHEDRIRPEEKAIALILYVWGLGWWFYGGVWELGDQMDARHLEPFTTNAQMLFIIGSLAIFETLRGLLSWKALRWPVYLLLPVLGFYFSFYAFEGDYLPFARFGWLVWLLGFAVHFWFLKRLDQATPPVGGALSFYRTLLHAGGLFLLVTVASFQSVRSFNFGFQDVFFDADNPDEAAWETGRTWSSVIGNFWGVLATAVVVFFRDKIRWPLKAHEKGYLAWGLTPIVFFLWIWVFRSLDLTADHRLLSYVPVFNPLELLQGFFFLAAVAWIRAVNWPIKKLLYFALGLTVFVWINVLLARSVSHWMGVPYYFNDLYNSLLFQTSLTIYWTVLAMTVMVIGTRKKLRGAWMVGASLLGLTVLKLLFVDLSKTQTIARVVSFVGAGLMILLIGYFSPLPPKTKKEAVA